MCVAPLEIVSARKAESYSAVGDTIFRSPPSRMPGLTTTDAIEISSAVSPEAGTMTSPPLLYTLPAFSLTKVSTSKIQVSYFV